MLSRYRKLLDEARSTKLEILSAWYSLFKMKQDPFMTPVPRESIDYFVDREDIVDDIIFDIGVASKGVPIVMLIVGATGSGKTAIFQYVANVMEKLASEKPEDYSFKGLMESTASLFESEDEGEEIEVHRWVKISKQKLDYLLVDDAKPEHIKTLMREFTRTKLKVFAISPFHLDQIYAELPVSPKIKFLQPLSYPDNLAMLNKRMKKALADENNNISLDSIFDEDALQLIHKFSMGIPHLSLKCASRSLRLAMDFKKSKVTSKLAEQACKVTKCYQAYHEFEKVGRMKMEVIQKILGTGHTPTEISSLLQKDRTTISRHLNELKELGLVELTPRGRESVFRVTEPIYIKMELMKYPSGEGEDASA